MGFPAAIDLASYAAMEDRDRCMVAMSIDTCIVGVWGNERLVAGPGNDQERLLILVEG
jgi:hypothetical protein